VATAGVHGAAGLPVAGAGQGGDQRDEGAEGAQREHAAQHPAKPRGSALPGEGPRQRGQHTTPTTPDPMTPDPRPNLSSSMTLTLDLLDLFTVIHRNVPAIHMQAHLNTSIIFTRCQEM